MQQNECERMRGHVEGGETRARGETNEGEYETANEKEINKEKEYCICACVHTNTTRNKFIFTKNYYCLSLQSVIFALPQLPKLLPMKNDFLERLITALGIAGPGASHEKR